MARKQKAQLNSAKDTVFIRVAHPQLVTFQIVGLSPLVANRFSEEAKNAMLAKIHKQPYTRPPADLEREGRESAYAIERDGETFFAHPTAAFRLAALNAHFKGIGFTRKALEQGTSIVEEFTPIHSLKNHVRTDILKNANGMPDLRYRMQFDDWSCKLVLRVFPATLSPEQLIVAMEAAGRLVGIGPQYMRSGLAYGRFTFAADSVTVENEVLPTSRAA